MIQYRLWLTPYSLDLARMRASRGLDLARSLMVHITRSGRSGRSGMPSQLGCIAAEPKDDMTHFVQHSDFKDIHDIVYFFKLSKIITSFKLAVVQE